MRVHARCGEQKAFRKTQLGANFRKAITRNLNSPALKGFAESIVASFVLRLLDCRASLYTVHVYL